MKRTITFRDSRFCIRETKVGYCSSSTLSHHPKKSMTSKSSLAQRRKSTTLFFSPSLCHFRADLLTQKNTYSTVTTISTEGRQKYLVGRKVGFLTFEQKSIFSLFQQNQAFDSFDALKQFDLVKRVLNQLDLLPKG